MADEFSDSPGLSPLLKGGATLAAIFFTASILLTVGASLGWFGSAEIEVEPDPPEVVIDDSDGEPTTDVAVVSQEGDGALRFATSFAAISHDLRLANVDGRMVAVGWESTEQTVEWKAKLVKPGVFQARINYATKSEAPAGILQVTVNGKSQQVSLRGSGGSETFVTESFFLAIPRSGISTIVLQAKEIGADGFIELRSLECWLRTAARPSNR